MKLSTRFLITLFLFGIFAISVVPAGAQEEIAISISVPNMWRDLLSSEIIEEFEAQHPGVRVEIVYDESMMFTRADNAEEYLDDLQTYASSADVLFTGNNIVSLTGTQAGYFLDLAPLISSDPNLDSSDFYPALWEAYQWNGGIWALPISADVALIAYEPALLDAAGVPYPSESWTIDDFASAARQLAQYNADGTVEQPGIMIQDPTFLLRALLGQGVDGGGVPALSSNPQLETILETLAELQREGVVGSLGGELEDIPIRIGSSFLFFGGFRRGDEGEETQVSQSGASLLPGGTGGLDVQGLAISSGTRYPEVAYELVKFLSSKPEIANNFLGIVPARRSLRGVEAPANENSEEQAMIMAFRATPPEIEALLDPILESGFAPADMLYFEAVRSALENMVMNSTDARTALQDAESQAITDAQLASDRNTTTDITVATPAPEIVLAPGETQLQFGVGMGGQGGAIMVGGGMPQQNEWDRLSQEFAASDPEVGQVIVESATGDLAELAAQYDCFTMGYNGIPGADLSVLLSIDPLLDTDSSLSRTDVLANALQQVQQDGLTWGLPVAIQPQALEYNAELFELAGVPAPTNGWTIEQFVEALRILKDYSGEQAPFIPTEPGLTPLLHLIAAYGGVPVDFRNDPITINFTDPANVAAIQQVLDLAKEGLIEYQELSGNTFAIMMGEEMQTAIRTAGLFDFGPRRDQERENPFRLVTYPQGREFSVLVYDITIGFISATAENPEACYRWLKTVIENPQLVSGIPAWRSVLDNPNLDPGTTEAYAQVETLFQSPNAMILSSQVGNSPSSFMLDYWLRRAFDRYVLEDADLALELADAEAITLNYMACAAAIPAADEFTPEYFQEFQNCAALADPTFTGG